MPSVGHPPSSWTVRKSTPATTRPEAVCLSECTRRRRGARLSLLTHRPEHALATWTTRTNSRLTVADHVRCTEVNENPQTHPRRDAEPRRESTLVHASRQVDDRARPRHRGCRTRLR